MRQNNNEINERLNPGINLLSDSEKLVWLRLLVKIKEGNYTVDEITINGYEIRNIPYYNNLTNTEIKNQKIEMSQKVSSFHAKIKEGYTTIIFSLFPVYRVSDDNIKVEVSEYFKLWLSKYEKAFASHTKETELTNH